MPDELERGTGTLAGARDHARSQAGRSRRASADRPRRGRPARLVWTRRSSGRATTPSRPPAARRRAAASPTSTATPACSSWCTTPASPAERLNVADTVKVQWQAYLGTGRPAAVRHGPGADDDRRRHQRAPRLPVRLHRTGAANDGPLRRRRASARPHPSGRDLLALGVAKLGLARRDVGPSVNLFKRRARRRRRRPALRRRVRARARYVELRAELDVLVTLANTPAPARRPRRRTRSTPVRCTAWRGCPVRRATDPFRASTPERQRAFAEHRRAPRRGAAR